MQKELEQILSRNIVVGINHSTGQYGVTAVDWQKLISELEQLFHKPPVMRSPIDTIVELLEKAGFQKQPNGDMVRKETGCLFSYATLCSYSSVVDFQLEWGYA